MTRGMLCVYYIRQRRLEKVQQTCEDGAGQGEHRETHLSRHGRLSPQ